ncbi:MAG: phage head morphogenesis protein [Cetobacterium sp.]|nr:phage head morphogenesis protein [Cetobacterium sp.]
MPGVSKKEIIINNLKIFIDNLEEVFNPFSKVISKNIYNNMYKMKKIKDIKKISIDYSIFEEFFILSKILGYINSQITFFRPSEFSENINLFDIEFQDAIKYLISKKVVDINVIEEITEEVRNNFIWIKKSNDLEITKKIFNQLEKHMENGGTFKSFKDNVKTYLNKAGLGEDGYYLQNVFRTNLMSAYNAGAYKQQIEVIDSFPYWMYDSVIDDGTTETCRKLDGVIYKANDPIWDSIYPPNHYGCRGAIIPLSVEDIKENNYKVSKQKFDLDLKEFEGNPAKHYFSNLKNNISKKEKEVDFLSRKLEIIENAKPYMEKFEINKFKPAMEREVATKINKRLGNDSVISHKSMQAYGVTSYSRDGKVTNITFKTGDKRTNESKIKTMFHELFHASAKDYKNVVYHELEETMAETIGTYLAEIHGANYKEISNSYIEILVDSLPKLKKLQPFKSAKTVSDFGKKLLEIGRSDIVSILNENNIIFKQFKDNKKLIDYILKYDLDLIKSNEIKEIYMKFVTSSLKEKYSDEIIKNYFNNNYNKLIEKIEKKDYSINSYEAVYFINALFKKEVL